MLASFRAELLKLRKRTSVWLITVVWVLLGLTFGYLFPYLSSRGTTTPGPASRELAQALPQNLVSTGVAGLPLFAGALALIIGVLCVGSEYSWQTMKVVLTQGPRRVSVLAGKVGALLVLMLILVLLTYGTDAAASWLVASVVHQPLSYPGIGAVLRGIGSGWLIVSMWATGGLVLAILFRGTALAIGLGLVWTLVLETLLRAFASTISFLDVAQKWFPGTNAGSLAASLGVPALGQPGGTPGISDAVSGTQATIVLIGYVVVFTAISGLVLRRRDVT